MVRKVGFGEDDKADVGKPSSIADRYVDRFRNQAKRERAAKEDRSAKVTRPWPVIVFLIVWLSFWTLAIVAVALVLVSGAEDDLFLVVWEVFAVLAWGVAVYALIRNLRGTRARKS